MLSNLEVILRLTFSALVGGLIGLEREANNRPAGLRTHVLVTLGSSLIMMISVYGLSGGDPGRMAAQVVSGIGFLGAGTILTRGNNIRGLTTAASMWVCGGIGLAIGLGYYLWALATAAIVLFTLVSLGVVEKRIFKKKYRMLIINFQDKPGQIGEIGQVCGKHNVSIKDIKILSDEEENEIEGDIRSTIEVSIAVKLPRNFSTTLFFSDIMKINGVNDVDWEEADHLHTSKQAL